MQHVFRVAILGSLVLIAAPAQAQQFSFMTGDRAMQGYAPRATNDGYQAGGGGNPGQAPDLSNSPYQSGSVGGTGPGQSASTDQGTGGGAAGGKGVLLRPADQGTGTNAIRLDGTRTLETMPTGGITPPGQPGGKPSPYGIAGAVGPIEQQKTEPRTGDPTGGKAGGQAVAIQGAAPVGFKPPPSAGDLKNAGGQGMGGCQPNCNFAVAGAGATVMPADRVAGSQSQMAGPPNAAGVAGKGAFIHGVNAPFEAPQDRRVAGLSGLMVKDIGQTGGGMGQQGASLYNFKFNAPQTQAFANLGSLAKPEPPPIAPVVQIPAGVRTQTVPVAPVANLGSIAAINNNAAKAALGSVGGVNSGMGAGAQLKNLRNVDSVNRLMLQRQKN